jgi:enamine deaminase RidA (YjgF/YER057c/UK114 family)
MPSSSNLFRGLKLPPPPAPKANYALACKSENHIYLSGHLPILHSGDMVTGFVGGPGGLSDDEGYAAAQMVALNLLATLKDQLDSLDDIEQVVKVFGLVNSHTDYKMQPIVINGCSDLMIEAFGKEIGYHARSAVGVNTLPFDVSGKQVGRNRK